MHLNLSSVEKGDLIQYLLSLTFGGEPEVNGGGDAQN
jgi:hypothetical protein